jgi:hypothetical protein
VINRSAVEGVALKACRPETNGVLAACETLGIGLPLQPLGARGFLTAKIDETTTFQAGDLRGTTFRRFTLTPSDRTARDGNATTNSQPRPAGLGANSGGTVDRDHGLVSCSSPSITRASGVAGRQLGDAD